MKQIKILILSTTMLMAAGLLGCAAPNMKLSQLATEMEQAPQDKALVTFIRPSKLGFKISAAVYDGDKFIGFVPYRTKLQYQADPGEHTFMVVSEAADFLKADLQAGKKYYIKVVPRMGAWRARFSLAGIHKSQLSTSSVQRWLSEAEPVENIEAAYTWANQNQASVEKKKQVYFEKWMKKDEQSRPYLAPDDGM